MKRRQFLTTSSIAIVGLTGCLSNEVGQDPGEEDPTPVVREDKGIVLQSLETWSSGERNCYHSYRGTVKNTRDEAVSPVFTIYLYRDNGQVLTDFTIRLKDIGPGETKDIAYQEKQPCFNPSAAEDYDIKVQEL